MKIENEIDNVRYRTIKVVSNIDTDKEKVTGYITVASTPVNDTNTEFRSGFSYCSRKDNFVRKVGQKIAYGRLANTPTYFAREEGTKFLDELKHAIVNSEKTESIYWMSDIVEINLK